MDTFNVRKFCRWVFSYKNVRQYQLALTNVDNYIRTYYIDRQAPIPADVVYRRVRVHVLLPLIDRFKREHNLKTGPGLSNKHLMAMRIGESIMKKYPDYPRQ
jgi:hypothetical protein